MDKMPVKLSLGFYSTTPWLWGHWFSHPGHTIFGVSENRMPGAKYIQSFQDLELV